MKQVKSVWVEYGKFSVSWKEFLGTRKSEKRVREVISLSLPLYLCLHIKHWGPFPERFKGHFQQYTKNIISLEVSKLHPKGNITLTYLGCKNQKPKLSSLNERGIYRKNRSLWNSRNSWTAYSWEGKPACNSGVSDTETIAPSTCTSCHDINSAPVNVGPQASPWGPGKSLWLIPLKQVWFICLSPPVMAQGTGVIVWSQPTDTNMHLNWISGSEPEMLASCCSVQPMKKMLHKGQALHAACSCW